MSDHVRFDGSRWGIRTIWPGGRVRWCGRWYRVEDGDLSIEQYSALPYQERHRTRDRSPRYDGRMDGMRGLFYTYGHHHKASEDHVYFHSIDSGEECECWPGPNCIDGTFVWESFALEASE